MLEKINQAFSQGHQHQGFALLKEYVENHPNDQQQSYRLAVISEQLGTKEETEQAYVHCLKVASANVLSYLYAGCFWLNSGDIERGISILSLGHDLDANLINLQFNTSVAYETRARSHHADQVLRKHFTELHQKAVASFQSVENVSSAIWPQTHIESFDYKSSEQKPHLFYLPALKAQPYWPEVEQKWQSKVNEYFSKIKAEFLTITHDIKTLGEPYLHNVNLGPDFEQLVDSDNWTALHLFKNGLANEALISKLPNTKEFIETLPLYGLTESPFEVFFSVLKADQHIAPHFGLSNHSLTVHLPIIVPGDGHLTVAGKNQTWQEGKLVVFDDSFIHEAKNSSQQDRVVLIFSMWHPELTEQERLAIQESFKVRTQWLESRHHYLTV